MNRWLWNKQELLEATDGRWVGPDFQGITGVSIDTRTLSKNDAYFAILGDVQDGHNFVSNAHEAGAAVSIVSEQKLKHLEGDCGSLVVVPDVLKSLEALGKASRARTDAQIVAITGSVGKTTTKEALKVALSPSGLSHASVASYNNHWGVPLTLARMPRETKFGIFEIGMNHPNEISPLVKLVQPHLAIITNVAAVHLGAFNSVDEIAHAKAEIFDGVLSGGSVLLNADDDRIQLLTTLAESKGIDRIFTFGESANADSHLEKVVLHGSCSCLTASIFDDRMVVKVGSPGRHIVQNILAVLAAVKSTGADIAKAGLALADFKPVKGRGERHWVGEGENSFLVIDESYNANPSSMRAALDLLGATTPKNRGRRIVVLGDMLELGSTSHRLHASLAPAIEENHIEKVFLVGKDMKALHDELTGRVNCVYVENVVDVIPVVRAEVNSGDVVMAKASLGIKFGLLVDDLLRGKTVDQRT